MPKQSQNVEPKVEEIKPEKEERIREAPEIKEFGPDLVSALVEKWDNVSFGRSSQNSAGTQTITHTLRKRPRTLIFYATCTSGTANASMGIARISVFGITQSVVGAIYSGSGIGFSNDTYAISTGTGASAYGQASVSTISIDNFILSWSFTGAPAIDFLWIAIG